MPELGVAPSPAGGYVHGMDDAAADDLARLVGARQGDLVEAERTRGRSVHRERWLVVVVNDDHNTFEGVATTLAQTLPNTSLHRGLELANEIHHQGRAMVWAGHFEAAEYYWTKLDRCRLSMAPLVSG